MKKVIILIIVVLYWGHLEAQDQYVCTNIGLREGLSNNFVLDMAFDKQGFLWVTTESGLNRICGNTHIIYKKENSGIISNEVSSLYADTVNDKMWIATKQDGLCIYDGVTHQFRQFSITEGLATDAVSCIAQATGDRIWILHWNGQVQLYDNRSRKLGIVI